MAEQYACTAMWLNERKNYEAYVRVTQGRKRCLPERIAFKRIRNRLVNCRSRILYARLFENEYIRK